MHAARLNFETGGLWLGNR